MNTHNPIDNDFTTRSGIFAAVSDKISVRLDEYGQYEYVVNESLDPDELSKIEELNGLKRADEDLISNELYGSIENIHHDPIVGYYSSLYCGYVAEGDFRKNGTSGGMATWLLTQLLEQDLVDGVVAVTKSDSPDVLYKYSVLRSSQEMSRSVKTKYYSMELSAVLELIASNPGRYAVIGIPSFISDIRRLQKMNPLYSQRILFTLSLLCGHQKTTKYGEAIAFQAGFMPQDVSDIDFRLKTKSGVASNYVTEITGTKEGKPTSEVRRQSQAYVNNWSTGMFKVNFSDFIDDCFGETADVTLGDAWLPEYTSDTQGNNVIIVRNPVIRNLIEEGLRDKRLVLDKVDVQTVKRSQVGLIRHYRTELPYRLAKYRDSGVVTRVLPSEDIPIIRRRIQDLRVEIGARSKVYYREAVERSDWSYFEKKMGPLLWRYKMLYRLTRIRSLGVLGIVRHIANRWR